MPLMMRTIQYHVWFVRFEENGHINCSLTIYISDLHNSLQGTVENIVHTWSNFRLTVCEA